MKHFNYLYDSLKFIKFKNENTKGITHYVPNIFNLKKKKSFINFI